MKNPKNLLAAVVPLLLIAVLVFLWDGGASSEPVRSENTSAAQVLPQSASDVASDNVGVRPEAGEDAAAAEITARARDIAQSYTLTEKELQQHILDRHGPDSTDPSKSRFSAEFDVRQGIEDALWGEDSVVKPNTGGRDGYLFEKTYEEPIGTDEKGREICTIRVVMGEDGFVVTAFPVK